jgi:hypothetical protein
MPASVQSPPPLVLPSATGNGDVTAENYFVHVQTSKWTKNDERNFSNLAALKAVGKASEEDLSNLRQLQVRRRREKNPMTGDEVLFHYQRRQMESELLKNLQQYVKFLEAPRRS